MITSSSIHNLTRSLYWWLVGLQDAALDEAVTSGRLGVA